MRIEVRGGPHAPRSLEFGPEKREILIGRMREADVSLPLDGHVSRRHALLRWQEGSLWVEDLGSTNGTFLGETRITAPVPLPPEADLRIGDTLLHIVWQPQAPPPSAPPPDAQAPQEVLRRMEILERISELLSSVHDLPHLLEALLLHLFEVVPAERGVVFLLNPGTGELVPEAVLLRSEGGNEEVRVSRSILERVVQERRPLLVLDALSDGEWGISASVQALGLRSVICTPLICRDELLGVLQLDTSHLHHLFTPQDLELVRIAAHQAALRIHETYLLRERAHQEALRTNLRRYFSPQVADRFLAGELNLYQTRRVEATILYSDIRDFTPLAETMEPDALIRLLNEYFSEMSSIILKHDGIIDKYIGDAILAVFGSPLEDPDHTLKALLAALEMQAALEAWNRRRVSKGEQEIRMGIGIHCGEVVHGNLGSEERVDFTVIGDTVNTAARLVAAARPGEIWVSDAVRERMRDWFEFEPLPPMQFKGKSQLIPVYQVVGPKDEERLLQRCTWLRFYRVAATTHIGRVREKNEDLCLVDEERGIFVVVDGVGSYEGGVEASQLTLDILQEHLANLVSSPLKEEDLGRALRISHEALREKSRATGRRYGVTLAVGVLQDRWFYFASVGDARVYRFREGHLEQLSRDQSVVWTLMEQGLLSRDQARRHPLRNVITFCLGKDEEWEPEVQRVAVQRNDWLLLCTDGLWEMLSDDEIARTLAQSDTPHQAVERLVELANQRGGRDNITVVVVGIEK